jgi:hypothetical protein
MLLAVAAALGFVVRTRRFDVNKTNAEKQAQLTQALSTNIYLQFSEQSDEQLRRKVEELAPKQLDPIQKQKLAELLSSFLRYHSNPTFEDYKRFRENQGSGRYEINANTNDATLGATWEEVWTRRHTAMCQLLTNLPTDYRNRIISFSVPTLSISYRELTHTNFSTVQLTLSSNYTGSLRLMPTAFIYDIRPDTIVDHGGSVKWVTWTISCRSSLHQKPGFVAVSAYWNPSESCWCIFDGTSASPPTFLGPL